MRLCRTRAGDTVKEPGYGAVVLDVQGYAWQHDDDGWHKACDGTAPTTWPDLVDTHAPIVVLHRWAWNEDGSDDDE